jgi:transposase InsO family protein
VALFTCLTVHAVHIEVVESLSTDAAIMAFRRFIARRGTPTTLYSDNQTAFVRASRELAQLYEQPVQEFAANERITWKCIPPSAPFMGGCWERLVRSVKTALSATLTQRAPSEEVL